jgi:hypothetical protein
MHNPFDRFGGLAFEHYEYESADTTVSIRESVPPIARFGMSAALVLVADAAMLSEKPTQQRHHPLPCFMSR